MNTTRLLVAEATGEPERVRTVHAERLFSVLSASRHPDDAITDAEVSGLAQQVADLAALAHEDGADRVAIVATAVLRTASNREEVVRAISDKVGAPLHVLDGHAEARLVFAGACVALSDPPAGEFAVVDVGGGSTEIAIGTLAAGPHWSASVSLGSRVLAAEHFADDPPTPPQLADAWADAEAALRETEIPEVAYGFAVGGDATTLHRLVGPILDASAIERRLRDLGGLSCSELMVTFDIPEPRARVLPAALLLLRAATGALDVPLRLCGGGLREGVVLALMHDRFPGARAGT